MEIQPMHLLYNGNNIAFLEDVIIELEAGNIDADNVLYRAGEHEDLNRILKYGTDRGGYPCKKLWPFSAEIGREILHEDIIYATTGAEIRLGELPGSNFQTSFKKFSIISKPLLLVYDIEAFVKVRGKQYIFKNPDKKHDSLQAIFVVDKQYE